MPVWLVILIVVVAVLLVVGIAAMSWSRRRTTSLRERFGPEYDRTVETRDDKRGAESELRRREKERASLDIKPLPEATRVRFAEQWSAIQQSFVDQPVSSVVAADSLVSAVMAERGYPVSDFAAQADLVSVDHPQLVEDYRSAHAVHDRAQTQSATTEQLREAMVRYRSLFDDLLQAGGQPGDGDRSADLPMNATRSVDDPIVSGNQDSLGRHNVTKGNLG